MESDKITLWKELCHISHVNPETSVHPTERIFFYQRKDLYWFYLPCFYTCAHKTFPCLLKPRNMSFPRRRLSKIHIPNFIVFIRETHTRLTLNIDINHGSPGPTMARHKSIEPPQNIGLFLFRVSLSGKCLPCKRVRWPNRRIISGVRRIHTNPLYTYTCFKKCEKNVTIEIFVSRDKIGRKSRARWPLWLSRTPTASFLDKSFVWLITHTVINLLSCTHTHVSYYKKHI